MSVSIISSVTMGWLIFLLNSFIIVSYSDAFLFLDEDSIDGQATIFYVSTYVTFMELIL